MTPRLTTTDENLGVSTTSTQELVKATTKHCSSTNVNACTNTHATLASPAPQYKSPDGTNNARSYTAPQDALAKLLSRQGKQANAAETKKEEKKKKKKNEAALALATSDADPPVTN